MAKRPQTPPKTFEDGLAELEQLITEIEEGKIGLEESLARQERGQFLLQYCRSILDKAEKQIEQISRGQDGSTQLTPLPDSGGKPAEAGEPAADLDREEP